MEQISVYDEVIAKAGSAKALQEGLGEKSLQTVCNWKERGFPANRCRAIAEMTGISVKRLRPDDWHDYWPEAEKEAA